MLFFRAIDPPANIIRQTINSRNYPAKITETMAQAALLVQPEVAMKIGCSSVTSLQTLKNTKKPMLEFPLRKNIEAVKTFGTAWATSAPAHAREAVLHLNNSKQNNRPMALERI